MTYPLPTGWMISVNPESPLYKAGLRSGDILTAVGGREIIGIDKEPAELIQTTLAREGQISLRIAHFQNQLPHRQAKITGLFGICPISEGKADEPSVIKELLIVPLN